MKQWLLLTGLLSVFLSAHADDLKAFPPAAPSSVRHVLRLPQAEQEENLKLELLVGRIEQVDAHNCYFFGGSIEQETIKGWGYPRYEVRTLGPLVGTRMGIDPQAPRIARFITLAGEPYLIRYNSRLPVVIYVPEGAEVRYRIWRADGISKIMDKG